MSDLIEREEIKKAIRERFKDLQTRCEINEIINSVPTAEPKVGKWIEEYNGNGWNDFWDYTCSVCGKKYERADMLCKVNFCPNCGARMKGE